MKRVLIVGAGASGLMAAISAARAGAAVTVLEHNRQAGKKLLATGNGRCNLTNADQDLTHYRGTDPGFAGKVLGKFGVHDTLRLFTELGIFTRNRNGWLYPYSDQASAVADVLRMEAEHRRVKLALNTQIQDISREEHVFRARTEGWTYEGYEGKPTWVDAYTDAAEVEIFINGTSAGRSPEKDYYAKVPCFYQPGELLGVGYDGNGKELYRTSVRTAGQETEICAVPDKTILQAGEEDFCFIDISVTDSRGRLKLLPERKVEIRIEGAGSIQGFGSANH